MKMRPVPHLAPRLLVSHLFAVLVFLSLSPAFAADEPEFDAATGYRISRYRSPVEPNVPGGKRVLIEDVDDLIKQGVVLIDVLPSDGAGLDRSTGAWHMAKPHENIPGSTWLPDVGRGHIDPLIEIYFKSNLKRLSGGDASRALLIYCQSDCWMGWNAVKRASSYGYKTIYWYGDGIDGWRDWERPFAKSEPVPVDVKATENNSSNASSGVQPQ
jgi:PQQ-dependent catabolism-associated CXXCW motif protein